MAAFELYVKKDSFFHRLDPRVRLLIFACSCIMAIFVKNLYFLTFFIVILLLFTWLAKIPADKFLGSVKMAIPLIISVLVLTPPFYQTGTLIAKFWIISIYTGGIYQGVLITVKIIGMILASFFLMFTTQQKEIAIAMVKIGVPFKYGMTFGIAVRFVPLFSSLWKQIVDAQKARGYDKLERGNALQKIRGYLPLLAPMAIQAIRVADDLAVALESRGFGAKSKRTYLRDIKMSKVDRIVSIVTVGITVIVLVAAIYFGYFGFT